MNFSSLQDLVIMRFHWIWNWRGSTDCDYKVLHAFRGWSKCGDWWNSTWTSMTEGHDYWVLCTCMSTMVFPMNLKWTCLGIQGPRSAPKLNSSSNGVKISSGSQDNGISGWAWHQNACFAQFPFINQSWLIELEHELTKLFWFPRWVGDQSSARSGATSNPMTNMTPFPLNATKKTKISNKMPVAVHLLASTCMISHFLPIEHPWSHHYLHEALFQALPTAVPEPCQLSSVCSLHWSVRTKPEALPPSPDAAESTS